MTDSGDWGSSLFLKPFSEDASRLQIYVSRTTELKTQIAHCIFSVSKSDYGNVLIMIDVGQPNLNLCGHRRLVCLFCILYKFWSGCDSACGKGKLSPYQFHIISPFPPLLPSSQARPRPLRSRKASGRGGRPSNCTMKGQCYSCCPICFLGMHPYSVMCNLSY